jgi:small GTP-binding protein
MLGASAVGKTSLVRRFAKGMFSDRYVTTIGVKIEKKTVDVGDTSVELMLWDVNGEDRFQKVSTSYLRGSAGYFLVADGTRPATLETAQTLHQRARDMLGPIPFRLLINKADLRDAPSETAPAPGEAPAVWSIRDETLEQYGVTDWPLLYTSAKDDVNVDDAFTELTRELLSH